MDDLVKQTRIKTVRGETPTSPLIDSRNVKTASASVGAVFMRAPAKYPSIEKVCADGGYRITFENHVKALGKTITVSEKIDPRE